VWIKNTEPSPSKRKICVLFFESSKHFNNFHYKAVIHEIRKKILKREEISIIFQQETEETKKAYPPYFNKFFDNPLSACLC